MHTDSSLPLSQTLSIHGRLPACLVLLVILLAFALPASAQQGSLDTTFDGDGKAVIPIDWGGELTDVAADVASQFDGKIVVVGTASITLTDYDFAVVRLNQDGSLDTSFGFGGKTGVAFDLGGDNADSAAAVAIQGDGKIVVAGVAESPAGPYNGDFAVARLDAYGSLDPTFGTGGKVVIPFDLGWNKYDDVTGLLIQSDGKIVVTGTVEAGWHNRDFGAVRLTASGALDSSFGTGGKVVVPFDQAQVPHDECETSLLQPDGKILLAGSLHVGTGNDRSFALARLNVDGSLDSSFGTNGKADVYFDVIPDGADDAYAVALDTSGRILVAGRAQTSNSGDTAFAVARLTSSGYSDTTFGSLGKTVINIPAGQGPDRAVGIAPAANGKIVVAGETVVSGLDYDFAVVRLLSNGSLDTAFGTTGITVVPFDLGQDNADVPVAMTLQLTSDIVVAGWVQRASFRDYDWAVMRLVGEPFFSFP